MQCGGVVIVPDDIRRYVPVEFTVKGLPVIQWEKDQTEEAGLVKIDLLGNRSLAVIRDAIDAVARHTGRDAIASAHALRPDLVVVDMELPDMDGTEVCRNVRGDAVTAQTTVVAHTAYSDTAVRQKAQAAGCHAFFVKGVDFRNLMALLTTMHARLAVS